MRPPDESLALDALAGRLDALGGRLRTEAARRPGDRAAVRLDLDALQSEAEGLGRPDLAEALGRLAPLTEIEECLAAEDPGAARELAAFGLDAIERLAAAARRGAGADPDGPAAILRESAARWGGYLGLLDPWGLEPSEAEDAPGPVPDEPAIDPGMLLRLLTGGSPPPPDAPEGRSKPDPPPSSMGAAVAEPAPPDDFDLDPELRVAFLSEASDLFERIESRVLDLDRDPGQTEALDELGRCFHTLKGAAGSVGLVGLAARIHALEGCLEGAGGGASADLLDRLHDALHDVEATLAALRRSSPPCRSPGRGRDPGEAPPGAPAAPTGGRANAPRSGAEETPTHADPTAGSIRVPTERIDDLIDLVSELIGRRGVWEAQAEAVKHLVAQTRGCRDGLRDRIDGLHDLGLVRQGPGGRPGACAPADQLRRLSEQVDDLAVLAEATRAAVLPLADDGEVLSRLTLQLWDALQAIRIVPARGLFQRLARVAHEAARIEGRRVALVMVGEETGLDRAVQDKAFEPLLHIVRNAVGHGIEPAEERVGAGKPPQGRIALEAYREGNTLVLSVQDDGRGLDYEEITAKGRRLGLIGPDERPGIDRLNALVFRPGFSTRPEANAIAGRGVGMDVVAQEVARLRGTVELDSQPGRGTRIALRLPARLALEQMVVVRVDGQPFAIPVGLIEHVQPVEPEAVAGAGAAATVLVRGDRVPLIVAREALGFSTTEPASCPKLLLVRTEGEAIALLVDAIEGARELVIKPMGPLLAGHPVLSGTSLSATGEVVLALNPSGLSRWHREGRTPATPAAGRTEGRPAPRVLVVDDSISVRRVVARQLRGLGAEVEEVSDGLEALGKLRSHAYRLVLTDLEMPRMDGFELLAELRRWTDLETPPVVVSSTAGDPATRSRVLALGARAFVAKPVDPDDLARAVQGLI